MIQRCPGSIGVRYGQFDAVVCTDVLEHVPIEELDGVIADLVGYARLWCFISVCCRRAQAGHKRLPGGRNVHVTIRPRVMVAGAAGPSVCRARGFASGIHEMKWQAITTCNQQQWKDHGWWMAQSYLGHWPLDVPLRVYAEGFDDPQGPIEIVDLNVAAPWLVPWKASCGPRSSGHDP